MADSEISAGWHPSELVETLASEAARRVIHTWLTCPRFLDPDRQPALLALTSSDENDGFIRLVANTDRQLVPAAVLDELLSLGLIIRHGYGHFLLARAAYVDSSRVPEAQGPSGRSSAAVVTSLPARRYSDEFIKTYVTR